MIGAELWLHDRLAAAGMERSGPRFARSGRCDCGAPVICGLNGAVCAFWATLDPYPLSPTGEALAALTGRSTALLRHVGPRWVLVAREPWHVRDPFSTRYGDVLADHRCGDLPPASVIIPSRHYLKEDQQSSTDTQEPPF